MLLWLRAYLTLELTEKFRAFETCFSSKFSLVNHNLVFYTAGIKIYYLSLQLLLFFMLAYNIIYQAHTAQSIHIDIEHIISYIKHRDQTRITVANSKSLQPSMREFRFCSNHYELMSAQNSLASHLNSYEKMQHIIKLAIIFHHILSSFINTCFLACQTAYF